MPLLGPCPPSTISTGTVTVERFQFHHLPLSAGAWTYVDAMEAVEPDEVGWHYSAPALPDGFIAIGHALWHVFAAYGLHCLVCLVIFIRAPLHGTYCYFVRSSNPIANLWLLVFPIVKYARDPLAAESWKLAPAAAPNVEV